MEKALVWFRNDLRIQDNTVLTEAIEKNTEVYCLYCYDESHFQDHSLGFPRTDSFRSKFLIEAVYDINSQLKERGSQLITRKGDPAKIVAEVAEDLKVNRVYASKEVGFEETKLASQIEVKLWSLKIELILLWQTTLYHISDLPWPIKKLPDNFTPFRKAIEKEATIKPATHVATTTFSPAVVFSQNIESTEDLGLKTVLHDSRAAINFHGGESHALAHLKEYIWNSNHISHYKETRNQLIGAQYSSKLSAWLAHGCISPRTIYSEIIKYENQVMKNESTYWLIFELLWRDYFKFVMTKYPSALFKKDGIKKHKRVMSDDMDAFSLWKDGKTGNDFIDANMTELNATGFMSNRGRQNVASYLINDLKVNWTWGASYFESKLIDYDVASNWGNWAYLAGVGNDPRSERYFDTNHQASRYDSLKKYRKLWLEKVTLEKH